MLEMKGRAGGAEKPQLLWLKHLARLSLVSLFIFMLHLRPSLLSDNAFPLAPLLPLSLRSVPC